MEFTTMLKIESWCLYALGAIIIACRLISRRMKLGSWRKLALDDYLMLFAFVCFTMVVVSINEVAANGSNYMSDEAAAALTPEGVRQAVYGSKMTFVLELFTLTATWVIKICLLIFYTRLTVGTNQRQKLIIKFAFGYCIIAYLLIMLLCIFYWCSPTVQYWAVPVKNSQCATYYHHMIFATAFNVFGDLMLFFIPIPVIFKLQLPLKKKILIIGILGLGIFNILATVLNRYYNFSNPNSYIFLCWYVAEVGIAVYVGNLPFCWPLFRLAMGQRANSGARSHATDPRSYSRKSRPLSHVAPSRANWDKLEEDGEFNRSSDLDRHTNSSDSSEVELVSVQAGQKRPGSQEKDQQRPPLASEVTVVSNGQRNMRSLEDKIHVTTVVNVSHE